MVTKITFRQNLNLSFHEPSNAGAYDKKFPSIAKYMDSEIDYFQKAKYIMEEVSKIDTSSLSMDDQLALIAKVIENVEYGFDCTHYTKKRWSISTAGITIWIENN